jgi:phosphatidylinositol glycan class U
VKSEKPASGKVAVDQRNLPKAITFTANLLAGFIAATAFLLLLSRLLLPSWQFIPSVYLTPLQLPDLTPNPGLWWYFFVEMFDAFRSFFLGVFWLHMLAYSAPLCLRLRKQPLAATVLMMGIIAIFEPYANIGAAATWLSCLCLLGHVFERKFSPS